MLAFPSAIKIYAAVQPVDMRKQFNGLWTAAQEHLREDPKNGALFVFINKERTRLKLDGLETNERLGLLDNLIQNAERVKQDRWIEWLTSKRKLYRVSSLMLDPDWLAN